VNSPIRIAISGAAGNIGYALVFRIAAGGMFGAEQPVRLSLLESPRALDLLRAVELELKDCAFPLLESVAIGTDPTQAFALADWIILLAGRSQTAGISKRIELLRENAPIFVDHGRAINAAAPNARILVVSHPCNTNCTIAKSYAPNVPADHWFALNRLDRMRATALIAERARVHVAEVSRVTVWGNHSESVYVDFHNAFIGDRPAPDVINDPGWVTNVLEPTVQNRSLEIIRLRGASPAATAAQAIVGTIHSITTPTPFLRHFGAGVESDGSYGIPRGLIFGFPLRTEDGKTWSIVKNLYLDDRAQDRLAQNVAELEHEAAVVTDLLGTARSGF
jgi:malate dehydrogenase